jgi:hypothetical protein
MESGKFRNGRGGFFLVVFAFILRSILLVKPARNPARTPGTTLLERR